MTEPSEQQEPILSQPTQRHSHVGFYSIMIVALLMLCGALAYTFIQTRESATLVAESASKIVLLQTSVNNLQTSLKNASELSSQTQHQIEAWQNSQHANLLQWHIAEARYLVGVASEQLQLTQNLTIAKTALEQADQILTKLNDPGLVSIRQSIATDLAAIEAAATVDVTQIYLKLNALNTIVDELPLPITPLTSKEDSKTSEVTTSNWQTRWQHFKESLQKIIIVRQISPNTAPLVLPEHKQFLIQNLHLQLEQAMWAALRRQDDIYQASLERASNWIKTYFVTTAAVTQSMLEQLKALQGYKLAIASQNLAGTLKLFEQYKPQSEPAAS